MDFDRIGVEIELPFTVSYKEFDIHRDASIEFPAFVLSGGEAVIGLQENRTVGTELVSYPMSIPEFVKTIRKLFVDLDSLGIPPSKRCGIHIHRGFPMKLNLLKNLFALSIKLEDLFIGMMGENRGIRNNFAYEYPLKRGVYVPTEGGFVRIPDIGLALSARTTKEFFTGLGIFSEEYPRYHPARYSSINLYSILLRGTVELRTINLVLNFKKFCSASLLFHELTEMAYYVSYYDAISADRVELLKELYERARQYEGEFNLNLMKFNELVRSLEFGSKQYDQDSKVLTHLRDFNYYKVPPEVQIHRVKPRKPGILDIHALRDNGISLSLDSDTF